MTYSITLKQDGGEFQADTLDELEAKIAQYLYDAEQRAIVNIECGGWYDEDSNFHKLLGLALCEVRIEARMIDLYKNDESYDDVGQSQAPVRL